MSTYSQVNNPVLQRPVEPGLFSEQRFDPGMNLSDPQLPVGLGEHSDNRVSDRAELAPPVGRRPVQLPTRNSILPPLAACETLEEGGCLMV